MEVHFYIRYYTEDFPWLCFRHATILAIEGLTIETEIDDYRNEYSLLETVCPLCKGEKAKSYYNMEPLVKKKDEAPVIVKCEMYRTFYTECTNCSHSKPHEHGLPCISLKTCTFRFSKCRKIEEDQK